MSTEYDIVATKGTSLNLSFVASGITGNLIDLTQFSASGVVRSSYGATGILLDMQPAIDPSYVSGIINVDVPATGFDNLPITEAVYDIKIYNNTGYVKQVVHGHFEINPAATI